MKDDTHSPVRVVTVIAVFLFLFMPTLYAGIIAVGDVNRDPTFAGDVDVSDPDRMFHTYRMSHS